MFIFIFPITWDKILKKEMVIAPGFEPRTFQLSPESYRLSQLF